MNKNSSDEEKKSQKVIYVIRISIYSVKVCILLFPKEISFNTLRNKMSIVFRLDIVQHMEFVNSKLLNCIDM